MKKWGLYYHCQHGYGIVVDSNRKKGTVIVNFSNKSFKPKELKKSEFNKTRFN